MATLRFRGTEFRNLIDVLAQATRASAAVVGSEPFSNPRLPATWEASGQGMVSTVHALMRQAPTSSCDNVSVQQNG
jgi:hypothetical protein